MGIISRKTRQRRPRESARSELSTAGMRVTSQRALILEILRQGQGHLDADEIYRLARQKRPRISLSTVYRTMQALKRSGLIHELHFDEVHHHYEVMPAREHHHLVCLGCGQVVEFEYHLSSHVTKNVPEVKGFRITHSELSMSGYCPRCQAKK